MKKQLLFLLLIILCSSTLMFVSCNGVFDSFDIDNDKIETDKETDTSSDINVPEPVTYVVTFDSNGGSLVQSQDVELNKKIIEPQQPTKDGYTFDGWYAGGEQWVFLSHTVDNDITLTAKWTPNNNKIVFNANGGFGVMQNMTIATDSSVDLTANAFMRKGYSFIGWSTSANGEVEYTDGASYTMGTEQSYTLYAVWETNENTLVFNANGGFGIMQNMTIATDSSVDLTANAFMRKGYSFIGWSTSANGEVEYTDGANYTMGTSENNILYAKWRANENTLVFNSNGGVGEMKNMIVETNAAVRLSCNTFTKEHYTFVGWSTSKDGKVEHLNESCYIMGEESLYTLYAVWKPNEYNITYVLNGGTNNSKNPLIYTVEDLPLVFSNPTNNREFLGWYMDSDFVNKFEEMNPVGNVVLYAKWDGFAYKEYDAYAEVINYDGEEIDVFIPATFNGKPVTRIGLHAFSNCEKLTNITIPNSVITIEQYTFSSRNIKSITVEEDNEVYKSIDGNLFSEDGTVLIKYAIGKEDQTFIIPDCVIKIGEDAFHGCDALETVILSYNTTTIERYAFYGCDSLTNVMIHSGVSYIGEYAFDACCYKLTIRCQMEKEPSGWGYKWSGSADVVWNW